MGLQSQLNDVSSDSIPLLLLAIIANFFNQLQTSLFAVLHSMGLNSRLGPEHIPGGSVGSGLSGLIVLAEQLNLNRVFSYRFGEQYHQDGDTVGGWDCVVCMSKLRDGDQVRRLDCRHVFHKACFDGWLDRLNFTCPLCRSSLVSAESVDFTRRRVRDDLLGWFSFR